MSLINRFSRETQEVSGLARQIAEEVGHSMITSIHFLLAILNHKQNLACHILESMGIDIDDLHDGIKEVLEPEINSDNVSVDEIMFSEESKILLEEAEKEMKTTDLSFIDPIHIFLAILKSKSMDIKDMITDTGLSYKEVRKEFNDVVKESQEFSQKAYDTFGAVADDIYQHRNVFQKQQATKKKKNTPSLNEYGKNLTQLAREGSLDPVIGRDKEIERIWRILARRKKNNAVIVGESGIGKTAIAEGLANFIANDKAPTKLSDKEIILLDISSMVAGSKYRGEFEKKMKSVIKECKEQGNIILFIDEIHTIIGAGGSEGSLDGANILKPALSSGELQVIGATTSEEYQKYFEKDNALVRRFQKLNVSPPDKEHTVEILQGLKKYYEEHHSVTYSDDVIKLIVELSERYIPTQYEPDRSINTLDEVGSKLSLVENDEDKDLNQLKKRIINIEKSIENSVAKQDYETAAELKKEKSTLETKFTSMVKKSRKTMAPIVSVTEKDVREVFSLISGVPVESISSSSGDAKRYLTMADELNKIIVNQDDAVDTISKVIKRKKAGVEDTNKPSVLLFAGPTGCGKTFTTKKLAKFLFGDEKKMVFLNGAEYADKTAVNRLTNSSPGYVGYGEATDFEPIRNNPYSILLIDECEKMHPDIWQIFLRIFEEGEIKTSNGKLINFKNTVIILTSNLGSEVSKRKNMGFDIGSDEDKQEDRKKKYNKAIKDYFKPEVYNRISKIVVFNDLNRTDLRKIVKLELLQIENNLSEKNIKFSINEKACDYLIDNSDDKDGALGARPIKRSIENHLNDDIADIILEKGNTIKRISVTCNKDGLKIVGK